MTLVAKQGVPAGASAEWLFSVSNTVFKRGLVSWEKGDDEASVAWIELPAVEVEHPISAQLVLRFPGENENGRGFAQLALRVYPSVAKHNLFNSHTILALTGDEALSSSLEAYGFEVDSAWSVPEFTNRPGILVLRLPLDRELEYVWPQVMEFVESGRRALIIDEGPHPLRIGPLNATPTRDEDSGAVWDEVRGATDPPHLWGGLEPIDLMGWREDGIVAGGGIVWDEEDHQPKVLAWGMGDDPDAEPVPLVAEFHWGKGRFLISRMRVVEKLRDEPVAPDIFSRMVACLAVE